MISTVNPEPPTIGTVARKRRRQILQSQRTKNGEDEIHATVPSSKKQCIEPITGTSTDVTAVTKATTTTTKKNASTKTKKPQMRYDPDVPMSKEEAAAWRKEQRRKRNRESAAASRQRQRDRISELEQEVSDWKQKYEEALARIEGLEKLKQGSSFCSNLPSGLTQNATASVSPCSSPRIRPAQSSDQSCGFVSLQEQGSSMDVEGSASVSCDEEIAMDNHVQHLSEKISRPAVKITGVQHDISPPDNVLSSQDAFALHPDPCTSSFPNMMPSMDDIDPISVSPVLSGEPSCFHDELEFDKFLLDAADWL